MSSSGVDARDKSRRKRIQSSSSGLPISTTSVSGVKKSGSKSRKNTSSVSVNRSQRMASSSTSMKKNSAKMKSQSNKSVTAVPSKRVSNVDVSNANVSNAAVSKADVAPVPSSSIRRDSPDRQKSKKESKSGHKRKGYHALEVFRFILVLITVVIVAGIFCSFVYQVLTMDMEQGTKQRVPYLISTIFLFIELCLYCWIWYCLVCEKYKFLSLTMVAAITISVLQIMFHLIYSSKMVVFHGFNIIYGASVLFFASQNKQSKFMK